MPENIDRYIQALFDHDEAVGEWYFKDGRPEQEAALQELDSDDALTVAVLDRAFNDFDRHLAAYSPWQVGTGFHYIFAGGLGEFSFALKNEAIPLETRVRVVTGTKSVFDRVFEPHCKVGAYGRHTRDLNQACFIFWDSTPLMYLGVKEISDAGLDVMRHCLESSNPAVVESGLHGLGHSVDDFPKAWRIVDDYIRTKIHQHPGLLKYAHAAREGSVL